ncbi:MAG TPA: Hsp20/alpha crystallin family protein [Casimicrobiaceae bacterium]|nr:Hsp20/alpha crystallin family protein [Casimicrobiaceae bacterium]
MHRSDPGDFLWAQACDLLDQAERLQRRFFRLDSSRPAWEPPVDMYENEREIVIVVAMPGVPADRVQVTNEQGALFVRGQRALPFAGGRLVVRHLEIPYGAFERRIALPDGRFESGAPELTHGCLVLRLRRIE